MLVLHKIIWRDSHSNRYASSRELSMWCKCVAYTTKAYGMLNKLETSNNLSTTCRQHAPHVNNISYVCEPQFTNKLMIDHQPIDKCRSLKWLNPCTCANRDNDPNIDFTIPDLAGTKPKQITTGEPDSNILPRAPQWLGLPQRIPVSSPWKTSEAVVSSPPTWWIARFTPSPIDFPLWSSLRAR